MTKKAKLNMLYILFGFTGWLLVGIGYSIPIIDWEINFMILLVGVILIVLSVVMLVKINK